MVEAEGRFGGPSVRIQDRVLEALEAGGVVSGAFETEYHGD